jgi:hypothetical protein
MTATTITIQTILARRLLLNRRLVTALGNNGRNAASAKPALTTETFDPNFRAVDSFLPTKSTTRQAHAPSRDLPPTRVYQSHARYQTQVNEESFFLFDL